MVNTTSILSRPILGEDIIESREGRCIAVVRDISKRRMGGLADSCVLEVHVVTADGVHGKAVAFSNRAPAITGAPDVNSPHGLVR